jgi:hypothetical protein
LEEIYCRGWIRIYKDGRMLNDILIELIEDSSLNQREFALKSRQSYSSINHWVNYESNLSFNKLQEICDNINKKLKIEVL